MAIYSVYLMLIEKRIADFLLVLIEFFFARISIENLRFRSNWISFTQNIREGRPPPTILLVTKLG